MRNKAPVSRPSDPSEEPGSSARVWQPQNGSLASCIDHTLLRPDATAREIELLCGEAVDYGFASVCVNSGWVARAAAALAGSGVPVCSVVGFPLGASSSRVKVFEAGQAIGDGAGELDMVINLGALKSGWTELVREEIVQIVEVCRRAEALCKVILETGVLSRQDKIRMGRLAVACGADFVKTSTGFGGSGATLEDVALLRDTVGPERGVKAAGGIRSAAQARALLAAGASRLGTSAGVAIVEEDGGSIRADEGSQACR